MQQRALEQPEDHDEMEPRARRSPRQRQGRRHRRPPQEHDRRRDGGAATSAACSWPSATRRTPTSSEGQLELDAKGYIVWTMPQRTYTSVEGRLRRRRRGRQLLPPGRHRRRHRLHGRPRRRTLAGGEGVSLKQQAAGRRQRCKKLPAVRCPLPAIYAGSTPPQHRGPSGPRPLPSSLPPTRADPASDRSSPA